MNFRLGKMQLRSHPLLPVLCVLLWLTGKGEILLPSMLAFFWHECGHLSMSLLLGKKIESMELTPMGGMISLNEHTKASPWHTFAIAAAGPLFSMLGCVMTPFFYERAVFSLSFACAFARANLTLLLFNLMPVLPLDGGRMAESLLRGFFPSHDPARVLRWAGVAVGAALCALSLVFAIKGELALSPLFAGLYLIYMVSTEQRHSAARFVTEWIERRQRLNNTESLPVELLAAGPDLPAHVLLKRFSPGKYHMILVLSRDGMSVQKLLDEDDFCHTVLSGKSETLTQVKSHFHSGGFIHP